MRPRLSGTANVLMPFPPNAPRSLCASAGSREVVNGAVTQQIRLLRTGRDPSRKRSNTGPHRRLTDTSQVHEPDVRAVIVDMDVVLLIDSDNLARANCTEAENKRPGSLIIDDVVAGNWKRDLNVCRQRAGELQHRILGLRGARAWSRGKPGWRRKNNRRIGSGDGRCATE